jgi:hypothetical protein
VEDLCLAPYLEKHGSANSDLWQVSSVFLLTLPAWWWLSREAPSYLNTRGIKGKHMCNLKLSLCHIKNGTNKLAKLKFKIYLCDSKYISYYHFNM